MGKKKNKEDEIEIRLAEIEKLRDRWQENLNEAKRIKAEADNYRDKAKELMQFVVNAANELRETIDMNKDFNDHIDEMQKIL